MPIDSKMREQIKLMAINGPAGAERARGGQSEDEGRSGDESNCSTTCNTNHRETAAKSWNEREKKDTLNMKIEESKVN